MGNARNQPVGRAPRGGARAPGTRGDRPARGRVSASSAQPRHRPADEPAGRSASRPAAARRPVAPGAAKRTRAPRPRRLTGRATVLTSLLLALLLAYAYPVRVYLSQQAEIAALEQHQVLQRDQIDRLTQERAKWNDDQYVIAQARSRLHYVLPGETPYVVLGGDQAPNTASAKPGAGGKPAKHPWYGGLWSSIGAANGAPNR